MKQFNGILFIDIETVSSQPTFDLLDDGMQHEWERKAKLLKPRQEETEDPSNVYNDRAGIYAEFAKIVCISFGTIYTSGTEYKIRLKSLAYDDEKLILTKFSHVIESMTAIHKNIRFCGHNIKEFDMPFICRRYIVNNLPLPACLQLSGLKPWEVQHIDTLELWKFGDYKNFTSLSLLSQIFGIPSPKSDIDGSQVSEVYWKESDLARISEYCLRDVLTTAKVYLRLKGYSDIELTPDYAESE